MLYQILGLLVLILDIYCIMLVLKGSDDPGIKLLWIVLIVFLPIVGPILFFLVGPGGKGRTA